MCSKASSKLNCFKRFYPYLISSLQSGLVMTVGDVLAQTCIEKRDWDKIQYERTAKFGVIGLVFTGPLLCHWASITRKHRGLNDAVNRALSTQIYMAPILNFGTISMVKIMNGLELSKAAVNNILKEDFVLIMEKNYLVWLPTQFLGYLIQFSPVKHLFMLSVSVIWYAYLSNILVKKN